MYIIEDETFYVFIIKIFLKNAGYLLVIFFMNTLVALDVKSVISGNFFYSDISFFGQDTAALFRNIPIGID